MDNGVVPQAMVVGSPSTAIRGAAYAPVAPAGEAHVALPWCVVGSSAISYVDVVAYVTGIGGQVVKLGL